MLKAGTETGSLVNHVLSCAKHKTPRVGDGATVLCWTDRHAGTIMKVTRYSLTVQLDKAVRVDNNGMSESQEYRYEPDPDGRIEVFRVTKRGFKNKSGNGLLIGTRNSYHDYSF
jgi:hypothetical protein